ncbi:MAG: lipoyl synthase, partial [Bacteroidetes bacterium RIFOXYB2_FULL_35_7]
MDAEHTQILRKPEWLKIKLPKGTSFVGVKNIVHGKKLHTICQSGNCPNLGECWGAGTATFMILGNICTRSCKFCSVPSGRPEKPNLSEPADIAQSVLEMGLKHCVLTSVDRDDLSDGGALIWAETIKAIRKINPDITIEALVPDFMYKKKSLDIIVEAHPEIVSHNLETVKRLTPTVRSVATYERSLSVLKYFSMTGLLTKSGIMVGIGE